MTRENKAGLAVAGVFLTLVTTVGVMKWRDGPSPRTVAMSVPAIELEPESPKAAKVTPTPVEKAKVPQTPAPETPGAMPTVDVAGQMNATPPLSGSVLPVVPSNDLTPKVVQEEEYVYVFQGPPAPEASGLRQVKNETPAPSGLPAVTGGNLPAPEIISPPPIPQPNPSDLAPPVGVTPPTASAAPLPGVVPAPKVEPAPPIPPIVSVPSPSSLPAVPGDAPLPPVDPTPLPPVSMTLPGGEFVGPPAPPRDPSMRPITPPPPPEGNVVPPVPVAPPAAITPVPVPKNPNPLPPVVKEPTEKTSSGIPLEGSRFVPTVTVSPPRPLATQPPMAGGPAPKVEVEPAGNQEPVKPPVAPSPTDGLRPIAVPTPSDLPLKPVPPSESRTTLPSTTLPSARTNVVQIAGGVVSAAPATPKVTRYDTQMYTCKQEDTWESISEKHLLSKNWADALRAFNMDSRSQNERVRGNGVLQAGDTVYIPPASVLDANYKTLIRKDGR